MTDGLKTLNLEEVARIDGGRIAACFAQELRRVVQDIDDRPADKRPRGINIGFTLKPDASEVDGLLDGVKMQVQVTSSIPSYKSKKYDFGVRDGQLRFLADNPTNHLAPSLPFDDDESEE